MANATTKAITEVATKATTKAATVGERREPCPSLLPRFASCLLHHDDGRSMTVSNLLLKDFAGLCGGGAALQHEPIYHPLALMSDAPPQVCEVQGARCEVRGARWTTRTTRKTRKTRKTRSPSHARALTDS